MSKRFLSSIFLVILFTVSVFSQDPVQWKLTQKTGDAAIPSGTSLDVTLSAAIEPGWHLYAIDQPDGGPIKTSIKIPPDGDLEISGEISATEPISKPDPNFVVDDKPLITKYYKDAATFDVTVKALNDTAFEKLALDVRYQVCNDTFCLPPKTVRITSAGSEQIGGLKVSSPDNSANTNAAPMQPVNGSPDSDLWGFIWLAATLGLLSLLTPCVFPMIPITISYFTNHSSGSRAKAVRLATVYSLGIIATFTLLGMVLAIFVGAAGINLFAANPWVNLVITAIFLFFAFNLFGAYELTVPSGLLTNLDRLTRSAEGEGSGFVGALLMGLTFTLTSFTCTSPFVGTILVSASQGEWKAPLLGMLVFSTVFALPFFVLALLPQLAAQLPRAGGWMNSVKVTMGFLEVAAAMKFLSNADLVWKWGIFTRDAVLAIWIAIGIILALYLLGKFQLAHDSKPERIGAVRLVAAILSLAISFYILTGLFGAKLGELEAFLPPDLSRNSSGKIDSERLEWIMNDYDGALQKARVENKPLFVDFTGYTCTNCRWMEANIFPRPEIEAELENMVLVRLYTDGDGEVYEKNLRLEEDMFGTVALPYYAIIGGDGKPVASFAGLTRNAEEFQAFLQKGTN